MAIIGAVLLSWPAWAAAEEEGECAEISANGTYKQMNLRASETLVNCEVLPPGSATGEGEEPLFGPGAFLGSDINVITGSETFPHVTQSESFIWSHGSTIVVAYNDSRGSGEFPPNYAGASVSTNGGESFSRLGTSSPFTGHGANYGDPIVVYNEKLEKWFAGFLTTGCGGQGIGLWTSTNGNEWSVGSCAHSGTDDDRESMWVDNNPSSPYYGRMYISYNDFAASGALKATYSDNGTSWSSPVTLFSGFRRNVQLAGSTGSEGVVFLVALDENGGGAGNTGQRNYMYRSTTGGTTWTSATMGSTFTIAGSSGCGGGYFPVIPPIWRQTGYGQPAVGPSGVLQYVYAAHGEGSDEADIFYVRSTNNGETWSTPLRLNTDKSGKAQWMPSLRVTPSGVVEASWYDRRNTTNGENYQRFARVSVDNGATWGEDEPLSTVLVPQPTQPDPNVQACYAGDYNYTTATANTGLDTWTDGRVSTEGNPVQKVFFHGIALQATPSVVTKAATEVRAQAATLNGTVNPNGSETTYQFEYGTTTEYGSKAPASPKSIGSGTSMVEVSEKIEGLKPETTYHFRLVATNAKGTTEGLDQTFTTPGWEILSTPNPAGSDDSYLYDVSCEPSTSVCTSVGSSISSGVNSPVAQRWNGTSWSEQSPAKKSGAIHTRLFGVDCPSEIRCIAVGNYAGSGGTASTLAELWNEGKWNVQTTPVPSEATSSELVAVGCNSTATCRAAGSAVIKGVTTAIMEKWTSPTWALESIPIPVGAAWSKLDGVDCIWSGFCVAVGSYAISGGLAKNLAMFWNGTSWTLQTLTAPEKAVQTQLHGISCTPSPNLCTAVGTWENSAHEMFTLAYRFNGSTWTLQGTPNPSGSIQSFFQDVSCATETSCTAVGGWLNSKSGLTTLAEEWNGTTWSVKGTPNPSGAIFSNLLGVSCRSTTCIGVGWSENSSEADTTLAETSDLSRPPTVEAKSASSVRKTKATLNGMVNPNGSETTYQFEYGTTTEYGSKAPASPKSIGSGTTSIEVSEGIEGLKPETTYHFRLVATNAKGTTKGEDQTFTTTAWEIVSTPNPAGATDSELYDVSCEPSTSVCTAVGKSTVSGADNPVAQRWNGTSWSEQSAAKKSGTLPTRLFGVDCPSETRCLAAGNYQPSEGGPTLVTEIWNENKWSVQSTPVPAEASSSELAAIGCNSTAQCRAGGSAVIKGVKTAIVEAWTSPTWTLQTIPIPEGATSSQLDGIDCIWSATCVAVGRYTTSGGSVKNLVMVWNGTNWSLQTLAEPEGAVQTTLLDVACTPSPTRCTAVGGWKNSGNKQFTLAYRYNGSTWTLQSTPNPSGSIASVFQEVSCASETSCTATGSWVESASNQTLAERWDGTSWSIQGTPNPSGAGFSAFFGVSCRSTTCMGVGWSTDGSGVDTTLGEIRE